MIPSNFVDIWS